MSSNDPTFLRFDDEGTYLDRLAFNFVDETDYLAYVSNVITFQVHGSLGFTLANTTSSTTVQIPTNAQKNGQFFLHANGSWATPVGGGGSGTPAGSNFQVQFNDTGAFGASSGLTFNKASNTLTIGTGTLTATAYSGKANSSDYIGSVPAANVVSDVTLQANLALYQNSSTLAGTYASLASPTFSGTITLGNCTINSTTFAIGGVPVSSGGSTPPSGSNTYVQFNDSGAFGGNSALTFVKTTGTLSLGNSSVNTSINSTSFNVNGVPFSAVVPGYLYGLTLSTPGSSTTFSVATGAATDNTNTYMMTLASALAKTTGAWAVGTGSGSLDTGTAAVNTWYHVFLIKRLDTGVVDVLISLSATTPTMPSNYTIKRRIGSMRTNASAQWLSFFQNGDEFLWVVPQGDVNAASLSTTATLYALSVPPGVRVVATFRALITSPNAVYALFTSADESVQLTNTPLGNLNLGVTASGQSLSTQFWILTNTSSQIRVAASAVLNLYIVTYGWVDRRGRDG